MAILSRSKITKERGGVVGASLHGFVKRFVAAYPNAPDCSSDVGNKPVAPAHEYPGVPGTVVSTYAPISGVLGLSACAEVASTIVKPIAVDVVDNDASVSEAKYQPVHQYQLPRSVICFDASRSVKRIGIGAKFCVSPFVRQKHLDTIVVYKRRAPVIQFNGSHHCSFDNALGGVAAASKVLAFGDQPSRDRHIVWR